MNRIQAFAPATEVGSSGTLPAPKAGASSFSPARGVHPHAFFAPLHYETNYAYPLLIWLHGSGDDETQLKRIMPLVSLRNYLGAAPRGTLECPPSADGAGYTWCQSRAHVALAEQRVFEALELARKRYHVSPRRIFLAGFDAGGTMAFRLAMSHPECFAGVLSFGGEFPTCRTPLVRLTEARRVPIFLACGRDSRKYPTANVCDNLKLFHAAGMEVALRQYPCGHQIAPAMLSDMDRWIMEQITAPSKAASE